MSTARALRAITADLRRALAALERLQARDGRPLADHLLDVLGDVGPLTTSGVRGLVARRRADVLRTLQLLEAAGRVRRNDGRWSLPEE